MAQGLQQVIPSEFIKLDDTVSDADRYLNVREQQIMRENYNIILARRYTKPLITQSFTDVSAGLRDPTLINSFDDAWEFGYGSPAPAITVPVRLNPNTRQISVDMYASKASSAGNIEVWPTIGWFLSSGGSLTVNAASVNDYGDKYSGNFNVPLGGNEDEPGSLVNFSLRVQGAIYGSDLKVSSVNVTAVGERFVDVDASIGASVGDAIYFDSNANIWPKRIVQIDSLSSDTRYWVATPWRIEQPVPGTDTANARAISTLKLYSLVVYENDVTDFEDAGVEVD